MTSLSLFTTILLVCSGCAFCYHADCVRSTYRANVDYCSTGDIYCQDPFECCDSKTACCYKGLDNEVYSTGEVTGLVLCTTSLATSLVLFLVICGATYCSNREDKSHIFGGN